MDEAKYEETIRNLNQIKQNYMELAGVEEKLIGISSVMGKYYTALCTAETALKREQPRQPKWGSGYYVCPQCGEYCKVRREERDKDPVIAVNRYCPECGQRLRE